MVEYPEEASFWEKILKAGDIYQYPQKLWNFDVINSPTSYFLVLLSMPRLV
jgi:hypothetical protein